jgi:cation:H+ antiporter
MLDFKQLGLAANFAFFALAAAAVWLAGSRIARYADAIGEKTGIGHALLGLVLLAGVTSLPEMAVSTTAAAAGDAKLAVNTLLGSTAMQITILAIVDFAIGPRALTAVAPEAKVILQGALNVLLLAIAAAGAVVGDKALLGVGYWAWACLIAYIGSVWLLSQAEGRQPWVPAPAEGNAENRPAGDEERSRGASTPSTDRSLASILLRTALAAAVILVAGYILSHAGGAIADETGAGSSFVGFLMPIATALPELSTALAAARLGFFTMAISDILGTNLINVGMIFLVDVASAGGPALNAVGSFSVFGALLGIMVTALFMAGLAERRDRTFWRMGIDSIAVLVVYSTGLVLLYSLR